MREFTRANRSQLEDQQFDLAVIGGGINGAAIAREASLRGLKVALLERADFGCGTSAWNSRLIHGGLRYLEHGEIPLVYESLRDRESLFRIASHLVRPLPFVVPLLKHNHLPGWMFRIGLRLYDALSLGKSVPNHRSLGFRGVAAELPGLNRSGLSGALHYYDGQVLYPERLVLENAMSAHENGAAVANYMTAGDVTTEQGRATGVRLKDGVSHEEITLRARCVVNAAGPWADSLTEGLGIERQIGGTTGTHVVVDPFPGAPDAAIYFEASRDNRPILVIPWNGRYLVGTTDDRFKGDPDAARGTDEEVDYLLEEANLLIPTAGLTREDVLYTYTGVRPLPYRPMGKTGAIPRSHIIAEHPEAGNLLSVVGGKLTPHLSLAREVVDKAIRLIGHPAGRSGSKARSTPLPGQLAPTWVEAEQEAQAVVSRLPWGAEAAGRIVSVYGARALDILELWNAEPGLQYIVGEGRGALPAAEVAFVLRSEAAVSLVDILHRRTMVGLEPALGTDVERGVAELAAELGAWTLEDVPAQLDGHRAYIRRFMGGVSRPRTRGDDAVPQPGTAPASPS